MAFEIPIDLDYFDHPKTKKLCLLLKKPEGEVYPLRLWKWCAKYAKDGILPDDIEFIEAELGWKGAPGRLHGSLMGTGFIDSDGRTVHDWMEGIGRAILIYERKKQKMRDKYDHSSGILPEESRKTSGSIPPTRDTRDTRDTREGIEAPPPAQPEPTPEAKPDPTGNPSKQAPERRGTSPEAGLVSLWNDQKDRFPISLDAGAKQVRATVAAGVPISAVETAFWDARLCSGKKIWDVLDALKGQHGKSLRDTELKNERDAHGPRKL